MKTTELEDKTRKSDSFVKKTNYDEKISAVEKKDLEVTGFASKSKLICLKYNISSNNQKT